MNKTILALIPALIVQIGGFFMVKSNNVFWLWLLIAILAVGGILSAVFVCDYIKKAKPEKSGLFRGVIGFLIFAGYIVTFFFTGCLLAVLGESR